MSIFSFLINLFNLLFNATKAAWNHLPKNVQQGIVNGSGIFNILSQFTGQEATLTIATIQANYPTENLDQLYAGLSEVAKTWGLTIPPTLEELVVLMQTHIAALDDTTWARTISTAAQILGDILTGASTPFGVIVTVIEWVYNHIVKPNPITLVPAPAPTPVATPVAEPIATPVAAVA